MQKQKRIINGRIHAKFGKAQKEKERDGLSRNGVPCCVAGGVVVVGRKRKHTTGGDGLAAAAAVGQVVMQGPGRFSCSLCGSVYRHLASLTQHLEVHRNQTTCVLCNTTLSRRTDLRRHMRLKHNMQWQKGLQRHHRTSKKELNS